LDIVGRNVGYLVVVRIVAVHVGVLLLLVDAMGIAGTGVVHHHVLAQLLHRVGHKESLYLESLLDQDILNVI
jgi:hypothetical protein